MHVSLQEQVKFDPNLKWYCIMLHNIYKEAYHLEKNYNVTIRDENTSNFAATWEVPPSNRHDHQAVIPDIEASIEPRLPGTMNPTICVWILDNLTIFS